MDWIGWVGEFLDVWVQDYVLKVEGGMEGWKAGGIRELE